MGVQEVQVGGSLRGERLGLQAGSVDSPWDWANKGAAFIWRLFEEAKESDIAAGKGFRAPGPIMRSGFKGNIGATLNVASREEALIFQRQGQVFAQLQSVAGGIGKRQSTLSSSDSSLDSSAASRTFSILSCSDSRLDSIALICVSIV
jgi:hypothetical protein